MPSTAELQHLRDHNALVLDGILAQERVSHDIQQAELERRRQLLEQGRGSMGWQVHIPQIGRRGFSASISASGITAGATISAADVWPMDMIRVNSVSLIGAATESCTAIFDGRSRLHCESGPAVAYSDGRKQWYWHGIEVSELVACRPQEITVSMIDAERNVEVRRVMIERFGTQRYIAEGGGRIIHQDETGILWGSVTRPGRQDNIRMVQVVNSTPEPDGSYKEYWLRVPPWVSKAREGVAWTFGLDSKSYNPERET
jgi:hypothetical protein